MKNSIPFGPVPSRRLGQSLGINNIPPKICTYSCIYCQIGDTLEYKKDRKEFYDPREIFNQVKRKVEHLRKKGKKIDYLSFVPDGEPTLDKNLGKEIELLQELGIPIAVISNSSLIFLDEVRDELKKADWVSLKVDAVTRKTWRKIDRPHPDLELEKIIEGILKFSEEFKGILATETMLIEGINTRTEEIKKIAEFLSEMGAKISYLAIPTRPPSLNWVKSPDEKTVNRAYNFFKEKLDNVELLIGYAGSNFPSGENAAEDILNITSVHPMRKEDIEKLLSGSSENWETVEKLIEEDKIKEVEFADSVFYVRKLKRGETDG